MSRREFRRLKPYFAILCVLFFVARPKTPNIKEKMTKKVWDIYWCLQCPFCKISWEKLPSLREAFGHEYDFNIHLTSLLVLSQSFVGQSAAVMIQDILGNDARMKFIDACFTNQSLFTNDAVGDARPSEIREIFAKIAHDANLLTTPELTQEMFVTKIRDYARPAWMEHKNALVHGVFVVPKHIVDGKLLDDTESSWGVDEFQAKLKALEG
jgi:hypothetical protein